ncbi:MAG: aminodeoxychorismate/anthranilate synthase component II [Bacteroidia bacterium]|nr:aminodeoxychorismate/anthranilate synthase component II [Bacteroidia bacterium]
MKVLVLDNYDSFTYNLVQYIQEILGYKVDVFRNDQISLEEVEKYDVIVLSPGPGVPSDAGIMPELIHRYAANKSILGVCLGHQAIGEVFGGSIENLENVFHGIATPITITDEDDPLFKGLDKEIVVGRYHSWIVKQEGLPDCFHVTAVAENNVIMAISHKYYHVKGMQFHPESIMTKDGKQMLRNFFAEAKIRIQENKLIA